MSFEIKAINKENCGDLNICDNKFMVYAELELEILHGSTIYAVNKLPFSYEKQYPNDDVICEEYIDNPDKIIFLAYVNEKIAG